MGGTSPDPVLTTDASSSSSSSSDPLPYHGTPPLIHNLCVVAAVLAPVGLLLPPRRMGLRTLVLAGGTFLATSRLTYDYTGQSLYGRFQKRASQMTPTDDLPEAALKRQAAMRAERERRRQLAQMEAGSADSVDSADNADSAEADKADKQRADWTRERAQREKEVLDSGGGYWELIMEQIGDVYTDLRGKKKEGENDEARPSPPAKRG